jgi:hypothetical protein
MASRESTPCLKKERPSMENIIFPSKKGSGSVTILNAFLPTVESWRTLNSMFDMYLYINKSETSIKAKGAKSEMLCRIGPGHEDLKEKLIPSWPPGCKPAPDSCIENVLMWPRLRNYAWGRMLGGSDERK